MGLVRCVVFEQGFELLHRLGGIEQRRQAQAELEGGVRAQHIACVFEGGQTFCARHAQGRRPSALQQGLQRIIGHGQGGEAGATTVVVRPRQALEHLVAQQRSGHAGLRQTIGRHLHMKTRGQQTARGAVFQAVEHLAHDAKTRWHHARSVARMDALGQHFYLQHATGHATQTGGEPELVVIACAAVQAHDQAHIAQARTQRVHVGQQIVRTRFFASLNQAHDARMRHALRFEALDGSNAGVNGVAVVRAAAPVQLAVFQLGRPRA